MTHFGSRTGGFATLVHPHCPTTLEMCRRPNSFDVWISTMLETVLFFNHVLMPPDTNTNQHVNIYIYDIHPHPKGLPSGQSPLNSLALLATEPSRAPVDVSLKPPLCRSRASLSHLPDLLKASPLLGPYLAPLPVTSSTSDIQRCLGSVVALFMSFL